ncbi:MAG: type IVB secretion system coupling complex protein DotM/IcmP [Pseudomonadota bacterium]|nr:type IVB secretion system coupling complex protein DotM/IcmP [Pseudomonadota bacterium]
MQGQQGGGQNSSQGIEVVYYVGALFLIMGGLWYYYHAEIVTAVLRFQAYQAYLMLFPMSLIAEVASEILPSQVASIVESWASNLASIINQIQTENYTTLSFESFIAYIGAVGIYFAIFTTPIWVAIAVYILKSGVATSFDEKYSMESFRRKEVVNWPSVATVVGTKLLKNPVDEGDYAMSLQPMAFAKKHNLLDVSIVSGKPVAKVNHARAHQQFVTQMGPKWEGNLQNFPPYIIALFAIFAAKANHDTKGAASLLRQIAESSYGLNKNLNFSGSYGLLGKHIKAMKVARAVSAHAFLLPAMASMLEAARDDGVIATAEFLWLKGQDRRLWYMLNCVGRQVAFAEVSGPFAHWKVEKRLRRPLKTPMLDEAIAALEEGVSEIIYKPDSEK